VSAARSNQITQEAVVILENRGAAVEINSATVKQRGRSADEKVEIE
jgi:hypothetical protein